MPPSSAASRSANWTAAMSRHSTPPARCPAGRQCPQSDRIPTRSRLRLGAVPTAEGDRPRHPGLGGARPAAALDPALRLFGQFLLTEADQARNGWDGAFAAVSAAGNVDAADLLLDALCLDPKLDRHLAARNHLFFNDIRAAPPSAVPPLRPPGDDPSIPDHMPIDLAFASTWKRTCDCRSSAGGGRWHGSSMHIPSRSRRWAPQSSPRYARCG